MLSKIKHRIVSISLVLIMIFGILSQMNLVLFVNAADTMPRGNITITVAVEAFTNVGGGFGGKYIVEPTRMTVPNTYSAADAVIALLGQYYNGQTSYPYMSAGTGSSFYLTGVYLPGYTSTNRANVASKGATIPNYLSEFDEGILSGWMLTVNNIFINVSAGKNALTDGTVVRWQYTCSNGDIGSPEVLGNPNVFANKDALTKKIGEINAAPGTIAAYGTAYTNAMSVLKNLNSTAEQITGALAALEAVESFVAVTDIDNLPADMTAGANLTLNGAVQPTGATNKTIAWSVKDAGGTDAVINGNVLTATAAGTVTVTATVVNGALGGDFTKDFTITVFSSASQLLDAAKTNKLSQIDTVYSSVNEADYTAASWSAFNAAIQHARADVNNAATAEAAEAVHIPSTSGLVPASHEVDPFAVERAAKIAQINAVTNGLTESYTPASWSALEAAIAAATAEVQNAADLTAINAVQIPSTSGLVTIAAELAAAKAAKTADINNVTNGLNQADYTPESWSALQTAIGNAIAAVIDAATIAGVNAVQIPSTGNLVTAASELAAARTAKIAQINVVLAGLVQTDYTPNSWTALNTAIAAAIQEVNSAASINEINAAQIPQRNSILVAFANKTALNSAVALANTKIETEYESNGWAAFMSARISAAAAAADLDADQNTVDSVLATLNTAMNALVMKGGYTVALNRVLGYLQTNVRTPNFGVIGGEWSILALARSGYRNTSYYDGYYSRVLAETAGRPAKLDAGKSTENSRLILALTAIGVDAANVGGKDLIAPLTSDMTWVSGQGINGSIFALIAMDSGQYAAGNPARQNLINYIVSKAISGGWAINETAADIDTTAMAIQSLAPYYSQSAVKTAVDKGLAWLSDRSIPDAESCSQVIVALSALGFDAANYNGKNYIATLLNYCNAESGAFTRNGISDLMATEQSAYALAAYDRYKTGKNSLYNMSDAVKLISDNVTPAAADKTALNAEIARAETYLPSESSYTAASWSVLTTALNNAKAARDNANSTQSQADAAANALTTAISSLTPIPSPSDPTTQTKYVWISVSGSAGGKSASYPSAKLEMNNNETAYSLLLRTGLNVTTATYSQYAGVYVSAINGLAEFDGGPLSGWMYSVNGSFPNYSSSLYNLKDGDTVSWLYTLDLGNDIGGGMGNTTTPDTTPGTTPGANTGGANTEATIQDGAATANAKPGDVKDLIGGAKTEGETNITLNITETKNAGSITLNLTVASIGELVKNGMDLTVQTDNGIVTFGAETLAELAADKPETAIVRIVIENIATNTLNMKQQAIVGWNPVISVSVWVGDDQIHDFKGAVTVTVSYKPSADMNAADHDLLTAYCLDDDGGVKEMNGAKYDAKAGEITFATNHFSYFLIGEWINPYKDVAKDWYYRAVRFVRSEGLMTGTGADIFEPESNLTRAMVVQILCNLEGAPASADGKTFSDVKADAWYCSAVAWASANGIVSGYGGGLFGPNDNVTREQLAMILHNYAKWRSLTASDSADLSRYTDMNKISDWALESMKWANANGLINGRTLSTLVPKGEATRAEAASIFQGFLEKIAR